MDGVDDFSAGFYRSQYENKNVPIRDIAGF